jgi:hypothetical protein
MTDEQSWADYYTEIDKRLDALRPQRAMAEDKEWREPVYGWARNHIPNESNLIRHFAEKEVDRREANAIRRGNQLLTKWAKGQIPLMWADLGPLPARVCGVRIRMDALTPDDMDDRARELRSDAKQVYDQVLFLSESLEDLARTARRAGYSFVAEIGDQKPRGEFVEDDPADFDDEWDADGDAPDEDETGA